MVLSDLLRHPPPALQLRPTAELPPVSAGDPALSVMTDLRVAPASTTTPDEPVEGALLLMKHAGVRFLFVVDASGRLLGSVSAFDILGEKRMLLHNASAGARHWPDLQVRDLMEPVPDWRVIDHADVLHLSVRQVVALLVEAGRRHLVVVESDRGGTSPTVRGLFSAARLQALLGEPFDVEVRATSFADIERRIA